MQGESTVERIDLKRIEASHLTLLEIQQADLSHALFSIIIEKIKQFLDRQHQLTPAKKKISAISADTIQSVMQTMRRNPEDGHSILQIFTDTPPVTANLLERIKPEIAGKVYQDEFHGKIIALLDEVSGIHARPVSPAKPAAFKGETSKYRHSKIDRLTEDDLPACCEIVIEAYTALVSIKFKKPFRSSHLANRLSTEGVVSDLLSQKDMVDILIKLRLFVPSSSDRARYIVTPNTGLRAALIKGNLNNEITEAIRQLAKWD